MVLARVRQKTPDSANPTEWRNVAIFGGLWGTEPVPSLARGEAWRQSEAMSLRPCLVCGTQTSGSRCPPHKLRTYRGPWRRQAEKTIAAHVAALGWWCPGWKRPAHPSRDLTVDHDVGVLCRSCNDRKGHRRTGGVC